MMNRKFTFLLFVAFSILFVSCKKDENKEEQLGTVQIQFKHTFDGEDLQFDQLKYYNEANNNLMFTEIQYFISEINLINSSGQTIELESNPHYIDTDINETHTIEHNVKEGTYSYLEFTFGLSEKDNISFTMLNSPEVLMVWPEHLGGGYHYMKLNGKYLNEDNLAMPFNFHLGISLNDKEEIVHNYFKVKLKLDDFKVLHFDNNKKHALILDMNVANWFKNPNIWDINVFGTHIMQNQQAMKAGCENGAKDVFSVTNKLIVE